MLQPSSLSTIAGPLAPELLRDERLHETFIETAKRHATKTALRCGDESLTYAELRDHAARFARYLRHHGVGRAAPVVIWMPRGLDMYTVFLGILEAGGCYVPLDPDFPPDRVAFVASDAGARAVVTLRAMADRLDVNCLVICFDDEEGDIASHAARPVSRAESCVEADDPAYIIYTSGTTGQPKGVAISHRAICHLVRSEGSVLGLEAEDVVFQGFSLSFDMSLEEIWPAFAVGATLLVATRELIHAAMELATVLAHEQVTVWSCVPTLLAMQEAEVPTLRLLNLGGEACPPDLVRRWSRPGLRILNTYGPTETTITATWAEVSPDRPVTIGRPLPNYTVHVLDEDLEVIPSGEIGELCITGPGLAIGYVGRDDLTREKFVEHETLGRLYRSGDQSRLNAAGEIEFLGRADTQVKIRGFRVELAEIEATLLDESNVRQAAAGLWVDPAGHETLVAWVVLRNGEKLDESNVRSRLLTRLPAYMVPAIIEVVADMPVLANGKTDRKNLPVPTHAAAIADKPLTPPATAAERLLHEVWSDLFAPVPVSVEDDFFLDLGGHSLRAAELVSRLRRHPEWRQMSMLDLYEHPTARRLAAHMEVLVPAAECEAPEPFAATPPWRHALCGLAQAASLPLIYVCFSLQLLIPYLAYAWLTNYYYSRLWAATAGLGLFLVMIPLMLGLAIALKWIVLGREKPGRYPLWGWYYFRWWFVQRMLGIVPVSYLRGTPLLAVYYRLLGARIGPNVHLGTNALEGLGLIEIGADSSIGYGAVLGCAYVERGWLKMDRIRVGAGCVIGSGSVIGAGAVLGERAELSELSLLPNRATIPPGERWAGSPAVRIGVVDTPVPKRPALARRLGFGLVFAVLVFVVPLFAIAPILPGMVLLAEIDETTTGYHFLWLAPPLALSFVIFMCLEIVAVKWLMLGRLKAGRRKVGSWFYVRWWVVNHLLELSLEVVKPLYATVYLAPWYRLLGVKVGRRAEVSTASAISPDLLSIGDESFVADAVILGAPRVADGEIVLEETRLGRRAFIGNSALLPAGSRIGDEVLIGCLSVPPAEATRALQKCTSWFGTPAVFLPQRQRAQQFDEGSTFRPGKRLIAQRYAIELVRVILPLTVIVAINSLLISLVLGWKGGEAPAAEPVRATTESHDPARTEKQDPTTPEGNEPTTPAGNQPLAAEDHGPAVEDHGPKPALHVEQPALASRTKKPKHKRHRKTRREDALASAAAEKSRTGKSIAEKTVTEKAPVAKTVKKKDALKKSPQETTSSTKTAASPLPTRPDEEPSQLPPDWRDVDSLARAAVIFPFAYMGLALCAGLFVVVLKWCLIGRYRKLEKPLWNNYVWRSELITSTYEELAVPYLAEHLRGTPFLPWFWRLLGARFGERVYADTTDITEFDVVRVADDAALNNSCGLQTHLFEDRVMKISTVDIGPRCTVGASAITLYDSRMEADSALDDLSMLMKGETLPAGTAWRGSPACAVHHELS
ncbi:MAG: amino acid adenylation domain-containing protein [Planctomycetes bacterium]|nr:amino acid adenylation domain-containing protein [Planctomycetota bacterium]